MEEGQEKKENKEEQSGQRWKEGKRRGKLM